MSLEPFTSSESDEWATPPEFVRPLADAVGGFDLDPASGAERSPVASETYSEADDGLSQPWHGRVWCNPPYSEMEQWTGKAVSEWKKNSTELIICLCKGDSSTDWWQNALSHADFFAAIDDRLSFGDGSGDAPFASHVFGFGEVPDAALDVLAGRGTVIDATAIYRRSEQAQIGDSA